MSQITVLNLEHRVLDFYIVDVCLFDWLTIALTSNNLDYFTYKELHQLKADFLNEFALRNYHRLIKSDKDKELLPLKALSIASRLYPWFDWFVSLLDVLDQLHYDKSILHIELTSR